MAQALPAGIYRFDTGLFDWRHRLSAAFFFLFALSAYASFRKTGAYHSHLPIRSSVGDLLATPFPSILALAILTFFLIGVSKTTIDLNTRTVTLTRGWRTNSANQSWSLSLFDCILAEQRYVRTSLLDMPFTNPETATKFGVRYWLSLVRSSDGFAIPLGGRVCDSSMLEYQALSAALGVPLRYRLFGQPSITI